MNELRSKRMRKLSSLQKQPLAGHSPLLMWVDFASDAAVFFINIQGHWAPCLLTFNHDDAIPYSMGWDDDDDDDFYSNDFDEEDDDEDDLFDDDDDDLDDDFDDDFDDDDDEFDDDDDDDELGLTVDEEEF